MSEDTLPEAQFDFEPLAREIVFNRLADDPDFAGSAAKTARDIILPALKASLPSQEPRITAFQVCRGILAAVLALDKPARETCLAVLEVTAGIAEEGGLEPADLMTWAMEGMASVLSLQDQHTEDLVHLAIEKRFFGAGDVFAELCRKHRARV
ncbi:MAG: hypothetical protein HY924_15470 [Elusimicrobia bacterium]|nr:hypothetical protein [Elusimicrobiota bacterium]